MIYKKQCTSFETISRNTVYCIGCNIYLNQLYIFQIICNFSEQTLKYSGIITIYTQLTAFVP